MKHIYLTDESVIYNPQTDCIYHLQSGTYELIVTFAGTTANEYLFFDVLTGLTCLKNGVKASILFERFCLLSNESFNIWATKTPPNLPVCLYDITNGRLALIRKFHYDFDEYSNMRLSAQPLAWTPTIVNLTLAVECKAEVKTAGSAEASKIDVVVGEYPILENIKPKYEFLSNWYSKFIQNNDESKLKYQYEQSKGLCHVRAHVLHELLKMSGIESVKLFKEWDSSKWTKTYGGKRWKFHCAVMVIDSDNRKWVLDPWVGFNHGLLSLKNWLFREDEPTPRKLLIAQGVVTNPLSQGNAAYGPRFFYFVDEAYKAFQAVLSSAVRNEVVFSIADPEEQCKRREHYKQGFFHNRSLLTILDTAGHQEDENLDYKIDGYLK